MNNYIECPECKCHVSCDKEVCTWCSATLKTQGADRQFSLGRSKFYSNEYEAALLSFDKATKLDPHHHQAWTAKVNTLKQLGKEEDISDNINRMLDVNVKYSSVWYDMGKYLYQIEHHGESVSALMQTIEKDPNHPKAWALLVDAFGKTANNKKITDIFSRALDQNSSNAALWYNLGRSLLELEKYEMAATVFEKSIDLDRDHPKIFGLMVTVLSKMGESEKVNQYVRMALEKTPKKIDAWYNLSYTLRNLGFYEEALEVNGRALQDKPETAVLLHNRGYILTKLERYDEAIAILDRAMEMMPDYLCSWHSKGNALCGLGKYEEAIQCFDKEIKLLELRLAKKENVGSWSKEHMNLNKVRYVHVLTDKADALKRLGLKEQAEEVYCKAKQYKSQ